MYHFLTDKLGLDMMLSNLLATKRIAESKKKTDRVDAKILAAFPRWIHIRVPRTGQDDSGGPAARAIQGRHRASTRVVQELYTRDTATGGDKDRRAVVHAQVRKKAARV